MTTELKQRYFTPEEYLLLEENAEYKSEYRDGEIIAMTGGTTNHNKIAGNFYKKFPLTIDGQDYEIFINDVRLWIERPKMYTYPDVMVVRGEPIYQGSAQTVITNPSLIVEVLSKSTQNYDRTDKFDYYCCIPEFKEYILIDQYKYSVKQFAKNSDNEWTLITYQGEDAVLKLKSVDFEISFKDIYERVKFDENHQ
jgi:Uma2 family endonuclease